MKLSSLMKPKHWSSNYTSNEFDILFIFANIMLFYLSNLRHLIENRIYMEQLYIKKDQIILFKHYSA